MRIELDLAERVAALERARSRQWWLNSAATLLLGIVVGLVVSRSVASVVAQTPKPEILTVRGLIVVDDNGVERVRIESPLPDPMVGGKRLPRQGVVSGILIHDSDGDERGGYVVSDTSGDAFLTLDAKGTQQALFLANRDGGANLSVWSGNKRGVNTRA